MIGSWSNRIIDESRCHLRDRHALDTAEPDVNYVALGLVLTEQREIVAGLPALGYTYAWSAGSTGPMLSRP